ncbi:TPA: hypothetical protein ACHTCR_001712 [Pseudomonas putida]|uniref:hypothetical protein n=1 Tax=Pseudomonas TaxID=286 RepID=UPI000F3C0AF3|nr:MULTISPECIES: hypothetical protein [Pseudomonas]MBP0706737.1 hypothetical protein [Pseudomonas sp. T34]MCE1000692.1 hypothetical protein [Pseudomonas sp. NMI1173_11]MCK2186174.1 hypothetical protein [Pseudomonas sp. MB04B]MDD2084648.1 hypothetical protein [Pseudomonas putida]MDD2094621.1 hypothetical protein [Pseudomonas putida]
MSKRFEIFVAMVDRIGKSGFNAGAAAAVHDQFNTDNQGFSLVVQTAQTSSAIASVLSVTQMTAGAVPFLNIVTNTLAGTVTFLKIVAESKPGKEPNYGDYINLVGNVAGVVAGFALLAGAPLTAGVFTGVALGASLVGTYNSELAKNIATAIAPIMSSLKSHDISNETGTSILSPSLEITDPDAIKSHFGGLIQVITWHPDTLEIQLDTRKLDLFQINNGAQSLIYGGVNLPVQPPLPTGGGATITLGIESINGQPPVGPPPSITTIIGGGQDKYACCTAPQQDKYR